MIRDRKTAHAPRTEALAQKLVQTTGPCVGCPGCDGLCQALIDALTVPDAVLSKRGDAA